MVTPDGTLKIHTAELSPLYFGQHGFKCHSTKSVSREREREKERGIERGKLTFGFKRFLYRRQPELLLWQQDFSNHTNQWFK